MPATDRLGWNDRNSDIISSDAIKWLNENVGKQAPTYPAFIAYLNTDQYDWVFRGKDHAPDSLYTAISYVLTFKRTTDAVMFKLYWGGA